LKQLLENNARPFLRWAGGKNWFVRHLSRLLNGVHYNNYHEPFLGGASVFFSLRPPNISFLSDVNTELITTYNALKQSPKSVIKHLGDFKNTKSFYYNIRDARYSNESKVAAKFIFLNQTSFNGIYRVNLNGKYNVPYGFRTKAFFEEQNLFDVSAALKNARIAVGDFEIVLDDLKSRDLVFLDPPYTVSHNNNGFIKYNQKLFSIEDQYRLFTLIEKVKSRGAYFILTNAAHKKIKEIFGTSGTLIKMNRASLIGGLNASRGETSEYVFTNLK
jgi:DNA adenine methylase